MSSIYLLILLMLDLFYTYDCIEWGDYNFRACYKDFCMTKALSGPKHFKLAKDATDTNRGGTKKKGRRHRIFWKKRSMNREDYMIQIKKDGANQLKSTLSFLTGMKTKIFRS